MNKPERLSRFVAYYDYDSRVYEWIERKQLRRNHCEDPDPDAPSWCETITYKATGLFITREDGERAEVYEPTERSSGWT